MRKIIYLVFLVCSISFGQRADFYREDITFRLDSVHLIVEGYYWFANHSDKHVNSNIFYPFPNYHGEKIDSIRLYNISAGQQTFYKLEGANGITFDLLIAPHDTALFRIEYRQMLSGDSAVYILRTTQGWGKPLAHAEYKLIVHDTMKIKRFSYPPDKLYNIENEKIYYWKKNNFMPAKDMIFYF